MGQRVLVLADRGRDGRSVCNYEDQHDQQGQQASHGHEITFTRSGCKTLARALDDYTAQLTPLGRSRGGSGATIGGGAREVPEAGATACRGRTIICRGKALWMRTVGARQRPDVGSGGPSLALVILTHLS